MRLVVYFLPKLLDWLTKYMGVGDPGLNVLRLLSINWSCASLVPNPFYYCTPKEIVLTSHPLQYMHCSRPQERSKSTNFLSFRRTLLRALEWYLAPSGDASHLGLEPLVYAFLTIWHLKRDFTFIYQVLEENFVMLSTGEFQEKSGGQWCLVFRVF